MELCLLIPPPLGTRNEDRGLSDKVRYALCGESKEQQGAVPRMRRPSSLTSAGWPGRSHRAQRSAGKFGDPAHLTCWVPKIYISGSEVAGPGYEAKVESAEVAAYVSSLSDTGRKVEFLNTMVLMRCATGPSRSTISFPE